VVRRRTTRLKEVFLDKWPKPFEVALWVSAAFVVLGIVGEALPLHFGVLIWAITIAILAKLQKVGDVVGILLFAYGAFETPEIIYSYLKLAATFYAFKVFFSLVKVLREEVLTKRVTVDELKEWDILGEWIYEKDGKIYRDRESSFDKLVRALRTLDLNALRVEYDKLIAPPTAEGLRKEDIETLKALVNEGKLEDEFVVRNAMPFAPALFLGFLISVFYGDLFWWLVLKSSGL
jgi:preflagellin peptidase FlaK